MLALCDGMPAIAPVPPDALRQVLQADGYGILAQDELNWVLAKCVGDVPIILPKLGKLVAVDVMMGVLDRAQMRPGRFFELLQQQVDLGSTTPLTN